MYKIIYLFLLPALVTACKAPPFSPDSPLTPVPTGSQLILHEALRLPPGTVSLWFQDGQIMQDHELDHYYPHCKFETLKMQDSEKIIQPDSFTIHKVVRWDDYAWRRVKLASLGSLASTGGGDDNGGLSHVNTATEMFLRSPQQPDVYRLICSQWEDASEATHVTVNQMRRVLGERFTLELPEAPSSAGS